MNLVLEPENYRTILESLPNGVYVVDRERRILLWNDGAEQITGYLRQEVIGRCCQEDLLMDCDERNNVLCGDGCPLLGTMHDGSPQETEVFLRHKSGESVPVRVRAVPLRDADGVIIGAVETFDVRVALVGTPLSAGLEVLDRTEEMGAEQVESRLVAALDESGRSGHPPAVAMISLDQLDRVRQSHGSLAAAALLRAAGHTLAHSLHPGDAAGRGAADCLLAVLVDCPPQAVRQVAGRIRQMLGMVAVPWWGDRLTTTVSVGATVARSGDSAEGLFSRSAEALAASVLGGGDRVEIA